MHTLESNNTHNIKSSRLNGYFIYIFTIIFIFVVGFFGTFAVIHYSQKYNLISSSLIPVKIPFTANEETFTTGDIDTVKTPATTTTTTPTPVTNTPSLGTTTSAMSADVSIVLDSLSQGDIRNNAYIGFDTSSLPRDTVVSVNKSTWQSTTPDSGRVAATFSYSETVKSGNLNLQKTNGFWKISSYTLE